MNKKGVLKKMISKEYLDELEAVLREKENYGKEHVFGIAFEDGRSLDGYAEEEAVYIVYRKKKEGINCEVFKREDDSSLIVEVVHKDLRKLIDAYKKVNGL